MISACSRSTIGFGVPAGATIICQEAKSKPGTPASATVGISGAIGSRVADDTPSARTLPSASSGSTGVGSREHHRNVAGDQIGQRRRVAAIRHVQHVDAGHGLEQLEAQVLRRAGPGRAVGELPGLRLGELDEVGDAVHRQRRIDHQHEGRVGDERDRREILRRIVGQVLVQRHVDGERRAGAEQERVAVGRRLGDRRRRRSRCRRRCGSRSRPACRGAPRAFAPSWRASTSSPPPAG